MSDFLIRNIRPADAAFACELIRELGHEADEKSLAWRISAIEGTPRERVVVAETEGRQAGLSAANVYRYFHTDGLVCRVTVLIVKNEFRNRGIGKGLVAWAENWAREQGCDRMEITARNERRDSLDFLIKQGYQDTSRRCFKHLKGFGESGEN
jgi:GNAT superfamily N-acetyltransferase